MLSGNGRTIMMGDTNGFNKTAKTIGSIKNRQVNYAPEHTFFSSATHMAPKTLETRNIVHDEIDRDLLGTKQDRWNPSVAQPKHLQDKTSYNDTHRKFLIR